MHEYELAKMDLTKAIELDSNIAQPYFDRALCFEKSNDLKLARQDLNYYIHLTGNKEHVQQALKRIERRIELECDSIEDSSDR